MNENQQEIRKVAIDRFWTYLTKSREGTEVIRFLIQDLSIPSSFVVKRLGVGKAKISRALNGKGSLEFDQRRLLLEMLSTTLGALEKTLVSAEKIIAKKPSFPLAFKEHLPIARTKLETGRKVMEREKENLAER